MKKDSQKRTERKRVTWTFQPEPDVEKAVLELLGSNPERGALTKLINASVRLKGEAAVTTILDEQIAGLEAKKKSLSKKPPERD